VPINKQSKYLDPKEVSLPLNNAAAAAFNTKVIATTTPERMKKLRAYLAAILDVVLEHRKSGEITAEELVFVCSSAALFIHVFFLDKTASRKLSMFQDISKRIIEDQDEM
jgi:hypothetical protein